MLVDMGGETTTVTIYKNGHLMYFATLPLGGRNITRDLTSLNILEERAEEIKITSGNAIPRETVSTLNYNGIRDADVSNIIVARSEEIVVNVLKQIQYAELKDSDLPGGIIVIGGSSKLNGMIDLLVNKSSLNVRRGTLPQYVHLEDTKIGSNEIIEVASVLYAGSTGNDATCLERPEQEKVPITGEANVDDTEPVTEYDNSHKRRKTPKGPGLGTKISSWVSSMFGSAEDDSDPLD